MTKLKFTAIASVLFSINVNIICQIANPDELKKEGLKSFKKSDYSTALQYFSNLYEQYPREPEYNYYYARCIYETGKDDLFVLAEASFEIAAVYGEKKDAWYYLGRIYQFKDKNSEAINAYDRFIEKAKKKDIKKLNVYYHRDMAEKNLKDFYSENENKVVVNKPIDKNEMNSTNEFNKLIKPALIFQLKSDSLMRLAKNMRSRVKKINDQIEKKRLSDEIYRLEKTAGVYNKKADSLFIVISKDFKFSEKPKNNYSITNQSEHRVLPASDTLFYTIQMGIFSRKLGKSEFNNVYPVFYEEIPENKSFKYYAGKFFTFNEASEYLKNIKELGYSGVFIIAFYNKNRISVENARKIEYSNVRF